MFCPKCGTEVPDDMNFCPRCGFSFAGLETQIPNVEAATRQLKITRKNELKCSAVGMEIALMDENDNCIDAYSLPPGHSCYMTCLCDETCYLRASLTSAYGKVAELVIEPGERNLNIVVSVKSYFKSTLQFEIV